MFGGCILCLESAYCVWRLYTKIRGCILRLEAVSMFGGCMLCLEAVYYLRRLYTMYEGCILRLEAVYYVRSQYNTFGAEFCLEAVY